MRTNDGFMPLVLAGLAIGAVACSGQIDNAQGEPYQGQVLAISSTSYCGKALSTFYDVQSSFQTAAQASASPAVREGCSCARNLGPGVVVSGQVGSPAPPPPNAGTLSITTASGTPVATLTPTQFEAYWMHATWSPGADLDVTATGDTIDGFTGALRTAAPLTGLTPSLASPTVLVNRDEGFQLSWTPGGTGTDTVSLQILDDCGPSCTCTAPVSAGKINLDPSNLATFDSDSGESCNATLWLTVTSTSTASSGNATIDLVGQNTLTLEVSFK
jgi:hypothetical protein